MPALEHALFQRFNSSPTNIGDNTNNANNTENANNADKANNLNGSHSNGSINSNINNNNHKDKDNDNDNDSIALSSIKSNRILNLTIKPKVNTFHTNSGNLTSLSDSLSNSGSNSSPRSTTSSPSSSSAPKRVAHGRSSRDRDRNRNRAVDGHGIPVSLSVSNSPLSSSSSASSSASSLRFLVADDNSANLKLLVMYLNKLGYYHVDTARNGKDLVKLCMICSTSSSVSVGSKSYMKNRPAELQINNDGINSTNNSNAADSSCSVTVSSSSASSSSSLDVKNMAGEIIVVDLDKCPYDMVFTDIQMPEMDGVDAAKIIRTKWKSPKSVVSSHSPMAYASSSFPFSSQQKEIEIDGNRNNNNNNNNNNNDDDGKNNSNNSNNSKNKSVCQKPETLPMIALTGTMDSDVCDSIMQSGIDDILLKPFTKAQLQKIIEKWTHKS
jgi:CheY-like chemotaxis protein